MNLFDELVTVVRALDGAGVDYALVGGLAVGVWGAPRATKDIDLLIRSEDLARAKDAARACGYTLEALPMRFTDGMEMRRVNKLVAGQLMSVDFILVDQNLEPAWQSRARRQTEVTPISVVSREALIAMKLAAGRPQDQADVIKLMEQDR
ncbi:MAG: nucleotidyl transferase AbiEii/AbiGii toxin family protein [Polyangiales bacterium]